MQIKLISSLEKCFLDEAMSDKTEYTYGSCFKNEIFHFGLCYTVEKESKAWKKYAYLRVESDIAEFVKVSLVEVVPVQHAADPPADENYLRKNPGLYPDMLKPLNPKGRLVFSNNLKSLMIEVDTKGQVNAGSYPITFVFKEEGDSENECRVTFVLEILDALLPEQELKYTQWIHCDCLMDFYDTVAFNDKHFEIIENYAKTAVRYGVNMLFTPIFTPPLDTYVGGERPTIQLVGVEKNKGIYSFDFSLLGKWVDMCNRIGIKYFEISHLFTQWGAAAAPKIMATVDGEYKKIFGWETDSCSEEYTDFLRTFIPKFLEYMKSLDGADKRCWFHISDEPWEEHMEKYSKAKAIVAPLLDEYRVLDALSSYKYYSSGVVKVPVSSTLYIDDFIKNNAKNLWGYYCVCENYDVSNRFIAMPSYRNRIIGTQLYKYGIEGFLHWGYNFYYNQFSHDAINPFLNTDADYFSSAGDAFSVYPGENGKPLESVRLLVFYDAIQDMRAFKLCENLYGKEYVIKLLEEEIEPLTFKCYPHNPEYLLSVREKINRAIIKNIKSGNKYEK